MAYYGVIDLGSNSVRLVIYNVKDNARRPFTRKDFHSVINEKKIAGLASYVQDGIFSSAGVAKAIDVVGEHLRRARNFNCKEIRVFATAVLRNCANSEAALKAVSEGINMPIDLLSERDEAHLGFVGATCDRTIECGTLIDIGGGSTELTVIRDGKDSHCVSLPQGSVSSYAQYVEMILPTPEEMHAIENAFLAKLEALDDLSVYECPRMYGIGGSTRAMDKMYAAAFMSAVRPRTLELHQIDAILTLQARSPRTFAHLAVKAVPDRLHTLVPGSIIAIALMRKFGAETLEVCKYGVREGYLIERILENRG